VLVLKKNTIGDAGVAAVAESGTLQNLEELDLQWNGITKNGASSLAASKTLPKLWILKMWGNEIGKAGRQSLETSPNFNIINPIYPGEGSSP
jgi:Ran GTPase-activating protein (RanGAP) involved in mRNA processing and transport